MKTIAELVNELFLTYRKPNGREYTNVDIARALDGQIDPSHISRIRNGQIKNPGRDALLALCQFFKVPPTYFFPELQPPSAIESYNPLTARGQHSPAVQQKIDELIEALRDEAKK